MLFTNGRNDRRGALVESVESRRHFSVSLAPSGFDVVTPSSDTRTIYVSSSTGSNQNNGRSTTHPVQTIAFAETLLRDGMPDHLLLKRGDRFVGGFGNWQLSGRSPDEPILIGSYGKGARPLINTGIDEGIGTVSGRRSVDNVVVMSLHFVAGGYDGTNGGFQTSGVHLVGAADHWLVEDCSIEGYKDNVVLDASTGGVRDFTLRRCEILDAYCASPTVGNGHAQGIYVSGTSSNTLIDQNIFDHNGWKEGVAGAEPTVFNHSMYINTGAVNTVITGNTVARSSLRGVLLRAGGVVDDNLFVQNPVAIQVGNTASRITGNVILDGSDQSTFNSGVGIDVIAHAERADRQQHYRAPAEQHQFRRRGDSTRERREEGARDQQHRLRLEQRGAQRCNAANHHPQQRATEPRPGAHGDRPETACKPGAVSIRKQHLCGGA